MADFEKGDPVRVPHPDTGEEIEGTFLGLADPDEAIEVPLEAGSRKADAAWIQLDDGTTRRIVFSRIRKV
jgi:hypothetical protein